jgi:DNA-binding Lrp family transcriptional regulator
MHLDDIDKKILHILQNNGRITNKNLAEQLNLSPPPTLERVKKLEKNGYIKQYVALLDEESINIATTMFVQISLKHHQLKSIDQFREKMLQFEDVMECYHVTGDSDYLLKVVSKDTKDFEQFIVNKLSTIDSIDKIKSSVVLRNIKQQTQFPLTHI